MLSYEELLSKYLQSQAIANAPAVKKVEKKEAAPAEYKNNLRTLISVICIFLPP